MTFTTLLGLLLPESLWLGILPSRHKPHTGADRLGRRAEAVGYPYVDLSVRIPTGLYPGHEQAHELVPRLVSLLGILLDLCEALA